MSDDSPPRPRQATLAGWLIIVGSVLLVISVFQRVSGLHSLETREAVQGFLAEPPGAELGLSVERVLSLLHVLSLVAGGCAAAMAILGYQALQRSRSARLALTVLAGPVFVTGLVAGGFLSSVVAAAAMMLWFQPTRDWFDGVRRPQASAATHGSAEGWGHRSPGQQPGHRSGDQPPSGWPPPTAGSPPQDGPRPVPGFGAPSAEQSGEQGGATGPGGPPGPPRSARPSALVWACALTWTFCGLAAAMMVLSTIALAAAPDMVFDELRRQQPELSEDLPSQSALQQASYLAAAVTVVWCVAASVLAGFAYRGVPWARVALMVSAGAAALLCLVGSVQSMVMLLPAFACVTTIALLFRPEVRAWYAARGTLRP